MNSICFVSDIRRDGYLCCQAPRGTDHQKMKRYEIPRVDVRILMSPDFQSIGGEQPDNTWLCVVAHGLSAAPPSPPPPPPQNPQEFCGLSAG